MLPEHDAIRSLFPFLNEFTYLDAAHYVPYPLNVVNKINEFINRFTYQYFNLSLFNIEIANEMRQTAAKMINAEPDDIIITSNTTHGINIFAHGLVLPENQRNVAFIDSEFPSVVYPWLNLEKLGKVKAFLIPSDKGYINEGLLKRKLLENNINVFSVSHVQFLGYRYDIRSIAEFCRKNGIFLLVDAIQATGVCPIDVKQMGIDCLCTGNQKWMMSPAGTGFTYLSKGYRELVNPSYVGTTSVNYDFERFLNYKLDLKQDSRAYENSTLNTLGMIGMNEAMKLFLKLGIENIYKHIISIQDYFIEKLDKTKFRIESDLDPSHRSNILLFSANNSADNKNIQNILEDNKIFIAIREGYLRLSPHIYNNFSDIDSLIAVLNIQ